MGNIVIATPLLSDAATLTTVGTVSGALPLTNLQHYRPSRVCRWTSLVDVSIVADLGASYPISLVALLFCNATTNATLRIRLADTEANLTAAPAADSGAQVMANPTGAPAVLVPVNARWARLDVADPTNPEGFFEAGRLYIDAAWQPARNLAYGWQLGLEDDSQIARSLSGGQLVTLRGKRRLLRAQLPFHSEDELYNNAYRLITERGLGRDLLVIRDPEATTHRLRQTVYGLLAETAPITNTAFRVFDWNFTVRELV